MTKRKSQYNQGLTLVEMLVVIAIFGVVTSILLFNYRNFNSNVSVRNFSQDIGLSIRKAQLYATSIRRAVPVIGQVKDPAVYGIVFSLQDPIGTALDAVLPNKQRFVVFADQTLDNVYSVTGTTASCGVVTTLNECLEVLSITTTDYVKKVCYLVGGQTTEECVDAATAVSKGYVQFSVLFRRPSPEAFFCIKGVDGQCVQAALSYMKIVVSSRTGVERNVTIWNTGQIAVQ